MRAGVRRLAGALIVLFGVSVLSFLFIEIAPGDPFDELRIDPRVSSETVAQMRARYGADRSPVERYALWLGSLLHGDLGYSLSHDRPVAPLLLERGLRTTLIAGIATLLSWLLALGLGVPLAARRDGLSSSVAGTSTSILLSIPELVVGLLMLVFAVRTGLLPAGGMVSPRHDELGALARSWDLARHLALPTLAMVLTMTPYLLRHVQANLETVLESPFVLAARAHGISQRRLLWRYALPAAAHPLLVLLGFSISSLLSASLVIEVIFSWPGMGPLLLQAILARDVQLVLGATLLSSALLIVGNLTADLLLYAIDPRVRRGPSP